MSYDFHIEVDTGGPEPHAIEPWFEDTHPAFETDGMAGTALATTSGYARVGNYTSNVSDIWATCLSATFSVLPKRGTVDAKRWRWEGHDQLNLRNLDGRGCRDAGLVLAAAVEWGIEHIDALRALNPNNGWGNAEGALTYLWDIERMCKAHPNATLRICA